MDRKERGFSEVVTVISETVSVRKKCSKLCVMIGAVKGHLCSVMSYHSLYFIAKHRRESANNDQNTGVLVSIKHFIYTVFEMSYHKKPNFQLKVDLQAKYRSKEQALMDLLIEAIYKLGHRIDSSYLLNKIIDYRTTV